MNFTKYMPEDYYTLKIVDSFNNFDNKTIDYSTDIYTRNTVIDGKLTLNHLELIQFYARLIKPSNFLELGVQYGECTKNLIDFIPNEYYGVDVDSNDNIEYLKTNYSNFKFYNGTTDSFFQMLDDTNTNLNLEMAFIDACHSHEASYKDFLNVDKHLKDDGIIFFHDTYPASLKWTDDGLCGNCYLTPEVIRKNHNNQYEILTLPINPGISIARKCPKQLKWL